MSDLMTTPPERMAYVCREPDCGCATIVLVDSERAKKENAREIAKAVRDGMTIERVPVDAARSLPVRCPHWQINSRGKRRWVEASK